MRAGSGGIPEVDTLLDLVRWRAVENPGERAYVFLADGEDREETLGYAELFERARAIACAVRERVGAGERALLLFPPGLDFIAGFYGCVCGGVVAVPAYPPDPTRLARTAPRLDAIVSDCSAAIVLTLGAIAGLRERLVEHAPALGRLPWLATDAVPSRLARDWREPAVRGDSLALLQYTSGSTAAPRGVMIPHATVVRHVAGIVGGMDRRPEDRPFSWLPLYHDMGLMFGVIGPVYAGREAVLMSPLHFLQRPFRWLRGMSKYRATVSGGPNFAYDLCARKIGAQERETLDLSAWKAAIDGAEPIRAGTLERFVEVFGPCGFRRQAFFPCYGLAEATLLVSGGPLSASPVVREVERAALEQRGVALPSGRAEDARRVVSCGRVPSATRVEIVDPQTRRCCEQGEVGEVWVSGPGVGAGYWNRPEESDRVFRARLAGEPAGPAFLRTGDLGFLGGGQLFIAGRLKDLIVVRGRNIQPQDVELSVEGVHPALRPGCGAAFSLEVDGEERAVVVHEVDPSKHPDPPELLRAVREAVAEGHDLPLHAVALLAPRSVPKTSSGKIQRGACRTAFLRDELEVLAEWRAEGDHGARSPGAGEPEAAPQPSAAEIRAWLVARVAGLLGVRPEAVDLQAPFADLGLDSERAVGLTGELEAWLERRLAPTVAYEHPSIERLAAHLAGESTAAPPDGEAEVGRHEVAIIGIGCRLPGAHGPEAFWELLRAGHEALREVPPERWDVEAFYDPEPQTPGKANTRRGGFLEAVDRFDWRFFGVSPREAAWMDPQQRLLLERAWEALEDAGQLPERLRGSRTGVFVGISTGDYVQRLGDPARLDPYATTGNAPSIAANRISYFFDFRGPSLAVDTACSSSLVAVHLACRSLHDGDCALALAAGVNLMLSPWVTVNLSRAGMLSPDGRCKAFDAAADGYVRGEGAAFVVLKPLARALADGDPVYAVIRGTAVNQDGRTNGLMAPNPASQEGVLRRALRCAAVAPADLQYVEAHGTGTFLGDPIEMQALGAVLGEDRPPQRPCLVGSVKTNIGHLEAAAGIAGLIKVALALRHRALPPSLHFRTPNPHIPFETLRLRVVEALGPWPAHEGPALAGVSSFGFGGTNAHAVLQEAPAVARRGAQASVEAPLVLPLSARTPQALGALAEAYGERLAQADEEDLFDLCWTAAVRRTHHPLRLAALGSDRGTLRRDLEARASESRGQRPEARDVRPVVFVFGDPGARWPDMGRALLESEPVFRSALERCAAALGRREHGSLLDELARGSAHGPEAPAEIAEPCAFAVQIGLAALWRSWNIEPDAVVGVGAGEIAAAHVAGALSLDDAVTVACERAALRSLAGAKAGSDDGPLPDRLGRELRRRLGSLEPRAPTIRLYSGATGTVGKDERLDADHWARNLGGPARLDAALAPLVADSPGVLLEVDPHPTPSSAIRARLAALGCAAPVLPSLRRGETHAVLRHSLAALYALGHPVRWSAVLGAGVPRLGLPSYPWQGERCWVDLGAGPATERSARLAPAAAVDGERSASTRVRVLPLAAQSRPALEAAAGAYRQVVASAGGDAALDPLCLAAAANASAGEHRLAVVFRTGQELCDGLEAFAGGQPHPELTSARVAEPPARLAFVFCGQATQWPRMGRELCEQEPRFREVLERCDALLRGHVDWSLLDVLTADDATSRLIETEVAQPAIFAVQIALCALWSAWGVRPEAVVGHSLGEVAAAHVAGALSLEDALRVVLHRARLMQRTAGRGAMAAVELAPQTAAEALRAHGGQLELAAINAPTSVVISGEPEALEGLLGSLRRREVPCRPLGLEYAFHSRQMDPILRELGEALGDIRPRPARLPIFSSVTGRPEDGSSLDAAYWVRNVRQPIQFAGAVRGLIEAGFDEFLEIGPHPALRRPIAKCLRHASRPGVVLASLTRGAGEPAPWTSLARLYARGRAIAWERVCAGERPPSRADGRRPAAQRVEQAVATHPLLGRRLRSALAPVQFEALFSTRSPAFLDDHRLDGSAVVPGAGFVSMALCAADEVLGAGGHAVQGLRIERPLVVPEGGRRVVQVSVTPDADGVADFEISALASDGGTSPEAWARCAAGRVGPARAPALAACRPGEIKSRCARRIEGAEFYARLRAQGYGYGPSFRWIGRLWRGDGEALARLECPPADRGAGRAPVHPGVVDACFQTLGCAVPGVEDLASEGRLFVPARVERLELADRLPGRLWCHARVAGGDASRADEVVGEFRLLDDEGRPLGTASGVGLARVDPRAFVSARPRASDGRYRVEWREVSQPSARAPGAGGGWLVLCDATGVGASLCARLAERGEACVQARPGERYERLAADRYAVDPARCGDFEKLLAQAFPAGEPELRGVVHLWSLDAARPEELVRARVACSGALSLVQALAKASGSRAPRLWLATRGTQPARPDDDCALPAQALLWGFARTLDFEHPEFGVTCVDLDPAEPHESEATARVLLREVDAAGVDREVALRGGSRWVPRLTRLSSRPATAVGRPQPRPLRADASYLISGGLGTLGLQVAAWMVERGARHLVLVGRREPDGAAGAAVAALRERGARVIAVSADVARRDQVERLLADLRGALPPLRGIVHAAGVLDDSVVLNQSPERFTAVLAPKLDGAWNLHALTLEDPLDFFVCFGSAASLLGSPGQANYAAANAFLDALAHHRRARGLPGLAIDWGPWAGAGMGARSAAGAALARRALRAIEPAAGLAALQELLASGPPQALVLPADWERLRELLPQRARDGLFAELAPAPSESSRLAGLVGPTPAELLAADPDRRRAMLDSFVRAAVAHSLELEPAAVDPRQSLVDLGFDSLAGTELRRALERQLQVSIRPELVLDAPTVEGISAAALRELSRRTRSLQGGEGSPGRPLDEVLERARRRRRALREPQRMDE